VNTPSANAPETTLHLPAQKGQKMERNVRQERAGTPVHETRQYETWDDVDVHAEEDKPWVRPTSLDAPPARPGFTQRWIRVGMQGKDDPTNTSRKFREGWKPRPASSVPASYHSPTIGHGKWAGCIGVEGMLLCEMPNGLRDKRNAHYREKTDSTTRAIAGELQKHSRSDAVITQERKSETRMVKLQDD
jgi:hypothetical protein